MGGLPAVAPAAGADRRVAARDRADQLVDVAPRVAAPSSTTTVGSSAPVRSPTATVSADIAGSRTLSSSWLRAPSRLEVGAVAGRAPPRVVLRAEEVALGLLQRAAHQPAGGPDATGDVAAEHRLGATQPRHPTAAVRRVGHRRGTGGRRHPPRRAGRRRSGVRRPRGSGSPIRSWRRRAGTTCPCGRRRGRRGRRPPSRRRRAVSGGAVPDRAGGDRGAAGSGTGSARVQRPPRKTPMPSLPSPFQSPVTGMPARSGRIARVGQGDLTPDRGAAAVGGRRAECQQPLRAADDSEVRDAVAVPVAGHRAVAGLAERERSGQCRWCAPSRGAGATRRRRRCRGSAPRRRPSRRAVARLQRQRGQGVGHGAAHGEAGPQPPGAGVRRGADQARR